MTGYPIHCGSLNAPSAKRSATRSNSSLELGPGGVVHEAHVPAVLALVDRHERLHAAAPRVSARIQLLRRELPPGARQARRRSVGERHEPRGQADGQAAVPPTAVQRAPVPPTDRMARRLCEAHTGALLPSVHTMERRIVRPFMAVGFMPAPCIGRGLRHPITVPSSRA